MLSMIQTLPSLAELLGVTPDEVWMVVAGKAGSLLLIWVGAWFAFRIVRVLARRIRDAADDGDDSRMTAAEKQGHTLSQLVVSTGRIVVLALAVLLSLAEFINIGPLLAGAGVLGLAVSFGAQSLVKDVISGFFILVEQQFAVGDVVEAAGKTGAVERITLRIVQLRDLEGNLHTIPCGQITTVTNRTADWSRAVVDVDVGYGESIDRALEVFRDEATRMAGDPEWEERVDGAPEIFGVQQLGESGVTVRTVIRTPPGLQWGAAREFRRRIKNRLDQEGIEIPFPQRTVHVRHLGVPPGQGE